MKPSALTLVFSVALIALFVGMLLMPSAAATIEAKTVKFDPEYMDLYDPDDTVTVTIRFYADTPDEKVLEINTSTVLLDGTLAPISGTNSTSGPPPEYSCDFDGKSVCNIMWMKIQHMPYNPQGNYNVALTITGKLYDGTPFTGTGNIKVKGRYQSGPPPPPPP